MQARAAQLGVTLTLSAINCRLQRSLRTAAQRSESREGRVAGGTGREGRPGGPAGCAGGLGPGAPASPDCGARAGGAATAAGSPRTLSGHYYCVKQSHK